MIIRQFRVDKLILGCGGIHIERGYAYYDLEETELRRVMAEVAKTVIVAADHSKFGKDLLTAGTARDGFANRHRSKAG